MISVLFVITLSPTLIVKLSTLLSLGIDPKRMDSVLPKCVDSLLSMSQVKILFNSELRAFSTCNLSLPETRRAELQSQADAYTYSFNHIQE